MSVKTAIVIGAGFGGLSLAVRLQSAGIQTTLVEARDKLGGRAYHWQEKGFTFDAGPTVVTDPPCLEELWALSGSKISDDVQLMPVKPFYRLHWPDGTIYDYANDEEALRAEIRRIAPDDLAGYEKFQEYSKGVEREGYQKLGSVAFLTIGSMLKAAPALARYQAWRSVYSIASSYVKNDKLRQALSFQTLLVGGNPMTTSSIYALIHTIEKRGGVWWAKGGTNRLVYGMAALFERLGGMIRVGDPVVEIETKGNRATGVRTKSGWHQSADAVATNGDLMHTYRDLLSGHKRGGAMAKSLKRKRWSPSLFVVHFGVKGEFPEIPHHMILFGPRYKGLLDDIYKNGRVPEDFSLYLHHPSVTDPSMAPKGHATFYVLAPVAHLGKAKADWDGEFGEKFKNAILDEVAKRLIPDLKDRLVTSFHYAPTDFGRDLSAHLGSAFSLEPVLWQSAYFRAHNRDDVIDNLYVVGAGTHPGAGIPGVVGSAKATAALMLEDMA